MFKKKINTKEYLELKQALESLRIEFAGLRMDFDLIVSKLKFKYKINSKILKEEDENERNKSDVIIPE